MNRMLSIVAALFVGVSAFAQTNNNPATANGLGQDSVECRRNISFFKTYAKSNNFQDAYEFWKKAYTLCPGASKDIYIVGAQILNWKYTQAQTEEEKTKIFDELMAMYDNRIKYFGDDPNTGTDYILASKASDYINLLQAKANYPLVYDWLKDIVAEKKAATDPLALSIYAYASMAKMMMQPEHKEKYIADYLMVTGYFDANVQAARERGDEESAQMFAQYKANADTQFGASGAASCDMVEQIFGPKIDEKKGDQAYLEMVVGLLLRVGCDNSPLYFKAAEYIYAISPNVDAAIGIARQALSRKDYDKATKFYEEAIKLSTNPQQKGEAYYAMAVMAYEQRAYSRARQLCLKAMEERSGFGEPMVLIANMYAATAQSIYPGDPVLQRIVYCLVVDKCERAKAIDPSIAGKANELISRYRPHYPSKDDVFMHPDISEGQSFTVGGWIGETTTIRTSN